jgi:integrase
VNTEKTSSDPVKLPDGTVVRFKTKKLGVTVFRQRFGEENNVRYSRPFYYSKMVAGKIARFPVGTDKARAERLAEEIHSFLSIPSNTIEMAVQTYNPRKQERATKIATFREVIDTYEGALSTIGRNGQSVSKETFKAYKKFMITFIRKVKAYRAGKPFESMKGQKNIDYSEWLDLSTNFLTSHAVMDFKNASVPSPDDEDDEEVILTAKISANTILRHARALFGAQAMRYYARQKLTLPDITGFMEEPDFNAKKYFELLPPDVIYSIMRASIELRIADLDAYRAFLLCMHCGLRRKEAIAFKPSWLRKEDRHLLYVTVNGTFSPKSGRGRKVAIEPWVASTLEELGPVEDPAALDRLKDWSAGLIPDVNSVNKAVHELRKCFISMKAKTEGLLAAQQQAGHKDANTTVEHYSDNMLSDRLIPLWKLPTAEALKTS